MRKFKTMFPEHFILKHNNLSISVRTSLWVDLFSVEEGEGLIVNHLGYGHTVGVCAKVKEISRPELVNGYQHHRFNR